MRPAIAVMSAAVPVMRPASVCHQLFPSPWLIQRLPVLISKDDSMKSPIRPVDREGRPLCVHGMDELKYSPPAHWRRGKVKPNSLNRSNWNLAVRLFQRICGCEFCSVGSLG